VGAAIPGARGALLVHGLGGTQYDLGSMHKLLRRAGVDTHSLTLPGHGGQPEDLLAVTAEQWVEAVTLKYRELRLQYETLHLVGMCMGSLLAIEVAKRECHERGRLIALAPPIYIDGWSTPWYREVRHLVYRVPFAPQRMRVVEEEPFGIKNELVRSIVKAKFERGDNFHYRWVPLYCIQQVDRLRAWVKAGLSAIRCPTLVVHAKEDELTSPRSAHFLLREIGQAHARMVLLENSYHMICVDNDREQVGDEVLLHLGFEPAEVKKRRKQVESVSMSEQAVREVAEQYFAAMQAGQFEAVFLLLGSDVRWHQAGTNPVAGDYEERGQMIDFFSRLMAYSDNSFRVTQVDEVALTGQTVVARFHFEAACEGASLSSSGMQRIDFLNGKLAEVWYTPSEPEREDAFWNAAAAAQGTAKTDAGIAPSVAALPEYALAAAFTDAAQRVQALPRRPANNVLLELYGLYKQGSTGDADGERPGLIDPVGRAKHDAWSSRRGMNRDEAMRRYISLVDQLCG
jgi:carboxylesterase